jgi:hypothetical protein
MVTMSTVADPRMPRACVRRALQTLLVVVFFAVQAAAVSHEMQHVLHQHDAPCGLHVAADHLVLVVAPPLATAIVLAPAAATVPLLSGPPLSSPASSTDARAPPSIP